MYYCEELGFGVGKGGILCLWRHLSLAGLGLFLFLLADAQGRRCGPLMGTLTLDVFIASRTSDCSWKIMHTALTNIVSYCYVVECIALSGCGGVDGGELAGQRRWTELGAPPKAQAAALHLLLQQTHPPTTLTRYQPSNPPPQLKVYTYHPTLPRISRTSPS